MLGHRCLDLRQMCQATDDMMVVQIIALHHRGFCLLSVTVCQCQRDNVLLSVVSS